MKEELVNKLLDQMEKVNFGEYKAKFQQESARQAIEEAKQEESKEEVKEE